jgi:hypothetical protein
MLPGDSIIDKIFEEGIKNAQAVIVVLSKFSVNKKWVREELNAGMVKKINGKSKVIPVLIDECEVPEALQSTVWEKIEDLQNYDTELNRIIASIYGQSEKPILGAPPKYSQLRIDKLPGLTKVDTLVFKTICEVSLEIGVDWINTDKLVKPLKELGISEDEMYESIDVLAGVYFIKGSKTFGGRIDFFQITTSGFERYARVFLPSFDELLSSTLLSIVNQELLNNDEIASHLNKPKVLIDYALDLLARKQLIKIHKTMGGGVHVHDITVQGKRASRNL